VRVRTTNADNSQRGGAGNEHREKYGGHSKSPSRETLGDKVKHLLHKDKKHEDSPLKDGAAADTA
jgi:hypothetical protein